RNLFLVSSLFIYIVLSYLFFARICIPPAPPPRSEPLPARVADIGYPENQRLASDSGNPERSFSRFFISRSLAETR
ncbi:hypothetical protein, partial [Alistipes finegoldii]|uniref:hypothetical protein n=1 Tax=Alistipes finegoldii TaxID=214856 RepID=UPI003AB8AC25